MRKILRYTLAERVVHWIAGLSYVYLLISGLAFFTPLLYWLTILLGGGPTARAWHPWAGLLFTAATVWMFAKWRDDMRLTEADRAWNRAIGRYIRNEDEGLPAIGRFNPGQKALFWVMFGGGLALLASGVVLWFSEMLPWSWRALRYAAVLAHAAAALLTIGGFIVHVYMGTAVVRGGFTSIVRGEVTEEWARTHHPLWLRDRK
ncbi:MAG: formate dehydrogenase subunit gamma [Bryobacteraceae bacterium]